MCCKINTTNKRANSGHINHLHTSNWWADIEKDIEKDIANVLFCEKKNLLLTKGFELLLKKSY